MAGLGLRGLLVAVAALPAVALMPAGAQALSGAAAGPPPAIFGPNVRADAGEGDIGGQGEPRVAVDATGVTYVSWQGIPGPLTGSARSAGLGIGIGTDAARTVDGIHFDHTAPPSPSQGIADVALATTTWPEADRVLPASQAGALGVFWGDVGQVGCGLEADVAISRDQGQSWKATATSCQPAQVDRDWLAAYTQPEYRGTAGAVDHTRLYDEYHDIATSEIWVTRSLDGGAIWDPVPRLAMQAGSPALLTSTGDTLPGGIAVDQRGRYRGRVYAVWSAADLSGMVTGCGPISGCPFDHVFISYSDDGGVTWTSHTVFNDPCAPNPPVPPTGNPYATDGSGCQDTVEMTPVAVDDAGNVFVVFVWRDARAAQPEYDVGLEVSKDGGATWNGGAVDQPGRPVKVNTDTGTHYEPTLVAGGDGGLDVVFYGTPYVEQTATFDKPAAASPDAVWNVWLAQTLDAVGGRPFTQSRVSSHAAGFGSVCVEGTFCSAPGLGTLGWGTGQMFYDDFGVAVGPDGGARVTWTDGRESWSPTCTPGMSNSCVAPHLHTYFTCQTGGAGIHGETVTGCGRSSRAPRASGAIAVAATPPAPPLAAAPLPNTSDGHGFPLAALLLLPLALIASGRVLRRRR